MLIDYIQYFIIFCTLEYKEHHTEFRSECVKFTPVEYAYNY